MVLVLFDLGCCVCMLPANAAVRSLWDAHPPKDLGVLIWKVCMRSEMTRNKLSLLGRKLPGNAGMHSGG